MKAGSDYKEVTTEVRNIKIPLESKCMETLPLGLMESFLKLAGFLSASMFWFCANIFVHMTSL